MRVEGQLNYLAFEPGSESIGVMMTYAPGGAREGQEGRYLAPPDKGGTITVDGAPAKSVADLLAWLARVPGNLGVKAALSGRLDSHWQFTTAEFTRIE